MSVRLRGLTWNHSRAFPPLAAASQRFEELNPQTQIVWEKRTLDEFGHGALQELARSFDLLIIDHPMLGDVHRDGSLMDLHCRLSAAELAALREDALGECLESYRFEGCLYALPVDAAAPAASYRTDLLERMGQDVPTTWDEVIGLARLGQVRMPGFPADLLLNFMGMCVSNGSFVASDDGLFDRQVAASCLEELRELASYMPDTIYGLNPICLYESMASGDEFAYCPFAYTYSNYSRPGFAVNPVTFGNPVSLRSGSALRTVLGGTGIAVSALCMHQEEAIAFSRFVSGRACQISLYGVCGGQPAASSAWSSPLLNYISANFFERTRKSVESAYVRPRYPGYVQLQQAAGVPIRFHLQGKTTAAKTLDDLDDLYRKNSNWMRHKDEAPQ